MEEKPFDPSQLVWANVPGPGGGGGGGGNQMKEPPAQMQTKPIDKIAVPIAKPTPQTPPKEIPKQTPELTVALNVPVKPMDAGAIAQVGTIDAPSAPDGLTGQRRGRWFGHRLRHRLGPGRGSGLGDGRGRRHRRRRLPDRQRRPAARAHSPHLAAVHRRAMRAKIQGVSLLSGIVGRRRHPAGHPRLPLPRRGRSGWTRKRSSASASGASVRAPGRAAPSRST
jgi:hypothetical protein